MKYTQIAFGFALLVIGLHLLRNLSIILYGALYLAVLVLLFVAIRRRRTLEIKQWQAGWWLGVALYGALVTTVVSGPMVAVYGLGRFLFAVPIFIALSYFTFSADELRNHIKLMCVFAAACAASIPLQIAIGPISWFANQSARGTFDRYSSLSGSLTSLGIIIGCFISVTMVARIKYDWLLIAIMVIGSISSLSKAAIANVLAGLAIGIWVNRKRIKLLLKQLLPLIIVGALSPLVPQVYRRLQSVLISFGLDAQESVGPNYDVSIFQSVIDRTTGLPLANFQALSDIDSPFVYLFGAGFAMASTALVQEGASLAPMAHNQFAELLTVFGPVGALALVVIQVSILRRLSKRAKVSTLAQGIFYSYLLFLLNSLFANGTIYQPFSAMFLYLAAYAALCNPTYLSTKECPGKAAAPS